MHAAGFDHYRCDKNISLGVNTPNLSKILKCAGNEDLVTIKGEEETDTLNMMFESPAQVSNPRALVLKILHSQTSTESPNVCPLTSTKYACDTPFTSYRIQ